MIIKNLILPLAIAFAGLFVTSCANNEQVLSSITLGSTELEVPMIGGEFSVPVNVTMGLVTATSSVDWIATCWQPDTKTLLVSVDENTEYKAGPRTGSITLDNEFCKVTLTVNQLFEDETYGTMSLYYADGEPFHPRYSRHDKDIKDPDFGFDAQGELEEQYSKKHRDHHQDEKCIAFFEVRTNQHEWEVKVLDKDNNELGEDAWLTVTKGTGASANYFVVNKVKPTNKTDWQVAKVVVSPVGTALNNQYAGEVIWVHQHGFELEFADDIMDRGFLYGDYDFENGDFVEEPIIVYPSLAQFLPVAFDYINIRCETEDWTVETDADFIKVKKSASGIKGETDIQSIDVSVEDNLGESRFADITVIANNAGVEVPMTITLKQIAKIALDVTPEPVLFAQTGHEVQNFVVNTNAPWGAWRATVLAGEHRGDLADFLDPFWANNWINEVPTYDMEPSIDFSITGWDGKNPTALAIGSEEPNQEFYNLKAVAVVSSGFGYDQESVKFLVEQEREANIMARWTDAELFTIFGEQWVELPDDGPMPPMPIITKAPKGSHYMKDIIEPLLERVRKVRPNEAFQQFATEEYDNTELAVILSNFDWEPTFVNEDGTEADWVTLDKVDNVINLKDKFRGLTATLVKISVEDNTAGIARSAKINLTTTGAITEGNVDKAALTIIQGGEEEAMIFSARFYDIEGDVPPTISEFLDDLNAPELAPGEFPWQGEKQLLLVETNYPDFDKTPGFKVELVDELDNPIEWASFEHLGSAEVVEGVITNAFFVSVDENNGLKPAPRDAVVRLTVQGAIEDNTAIMDVPFEQEAGLDFTVDAEKHVIFLEGTEWSVVPIMVSNEDYDCLKFTKIEVSSDCLACEPVDDASISEKQAPYQDGIDEDNSNNHASLYEGGENLFKWWDYTDIGKWHFARIFNPGEACPGDGTEHKLPTENALTVPALEQYIFVKANHINTAWTSVEYNVPDSDAKYEQGEPNPNEEVADRAVKLVITGEFRDNNDNLIVIRTAEFWVVQLGQHYNPYLPIGDYEDFRPVPTADTDDE